MNIKMYAQSYQVNLCEIADYLKIPRKRFYYVLEHKTIPRKDEVKIINAILHIFKTRSYLK